MKLRLGRAADNQTTDYVLVGVCPTCLLFGHCPEALQPTSDAPKTQFAVDVAALNGQPWPGFELPDDRLEKTLAATSDARESLTGRTSGTAATIAPPLDATYRVAAFRLL
jgi:hypothetical protein